MTVPTPPSESWTPKIWRETPALQQATYPDPGAVDAVVRTIAAMPPLVTSWEIETLKTRLGEAARGERFLLQGGDCAERFADCVPDAITNKLKILLQMSLVLVHGGRKPVIRVGRFAGQYAKPRSADTEERDGVALPSYRGDIVNRSAFTTSDRTPDPELMLRAYERAALTLNFIRALIDGGFADLHHPEYWDLDFVQHAEHPEEYQQITEAIGEAIRFMETISGTAVHQTQRVDFFTSHEGLHLYYEEALTRRVPRRDGWYNLSTHLPWIGLRTADPDGAHVAFFRGVRNPIGVKIGPGMSVDQLKRLLDVLHPDDEPGRLTLIHRFGAHDIADGLPPFIEAVQGSGKTVLWVCDPMHGNTETTGNGIKTRKFEHILAELEQAFEIHAAHDSVLGGVHFELTGENVTECMGGARGLSEDDLRLKYVSEVDPRLNYEQALEMALRIARRLRAT